MSKLDFLIFYEHEQREIDSVLLLRECLLMKGYSCDFSSTGTWGYWRKILFSRPKVVIVPWLRYNTNVAQFTAFLLKRRIKIVNLQWEQIYNKRNLDLGLTLISGEAIHAMHLCWGKKSYERLLKEGINQKDLKITGPIHLDFARMGNSICFSKEYLSQEFNLPLTRKWRLFISSFRHATLPQFYLDNLYKKYGDMSEFVRVSKLSRDIILQWYECALQKYPEFIFIYRPHPSEYADKRLNLLTKKYRNFHVISKYPIRHWILNADIIDTWYSTSIAEIYVLQKTCFILRPVEIPDEYEVEIMKDASFVTEKNDFIKSFTSSNNVFPISKSVLNSFYEIDDNEFSVIRIANTLIEVLNNQSYYYDYKSNVFNTGFLFRFLKIIITSFIGDICFVTHIPLFLTQRLKRLNDININQRRKFANKSLLFRGILKNFIS